MTPTPRSLPPRRSTREDHRLAPTGIRSAPRAVAGRIARALAAIAFVACLAPACARAPNADSERTATAPVPATAVAHPSALAAAVATPPFYRIDGGDGATLLLLGTVHFGPPAGWSLSPAITTALARADRFVFEVDLRLVSEEAVGDLLAELAVLEPGRTLPALVSPEAVALLEEHDERLTRMGFPPGARNGREPWYLATRLIESSVEEGGWSTAAMVELQLFSAIGDRPLVGLETVEEQLRIMDGLPYSLQDLILRDTLTHLDESEGSLARVARAWQTGDEKELGALAREGTDELPGLDRFYDVLLGERNRRWIEALRPLLDDRRHAGETVFVAVGALHLVGRDGLVELFRDAGYRAHAIEQEAALR